MNLIAAAIAVPMFVALQLFFARNTISTRIAGWIGAATMGATLLLLVFAWNVGAVGDSRWRDEFDASWIDSLAIHFHVGLDGVSWPLALMTALLALLACVSLTEGDIGTPPLIALILVIAAASIGVFVSLDLLLFFIFFELALVPMWFVIAWWGSSAASPPGHRSEGSGSKNVPADETARYAATRFLLFTVLGSALMLVGFVIVGSQVGSLQIDDIVATGLGGSTGLLAVTLIALGFAVKTPIVPLHTWLPDAHGKAPTVGSVLLAGVFLKLGTYGLIRMCVDLLPAETARIAPALAIAGVVGIIYSALACLAQDDLKRLIAYSSIGHMGFVVLGLATMSAVGLAAAVFGSVAHGLITGLLFFNTGWLKERYGTASLRAIGRGLYARAPQLGALFAFAAIASLGLPGLAGFWGEMLSLRAAYGLGVLDRALAWPLMAIAAIGIVMATAYFARAIRALDQGEPEPQSADRDLTVTEKSVAGVLVLAIVVLGVAPGLLMGVIEPAVAAIVGAR